MNDLDEIPEIPAEVIANMTLTKPSEPLIVYKSCETQMSTEVLTKDEIIEIRKQTVGNPVQWGDTIAFARNLEYHIISKIFTKI